jgi:hypothetical protein
MSMNFFDAAFAVLRLVEQCERRGEFNVCAEFNAITGRDRAICAMPMLCPSRGWLSQAAWYGHVECYCATVQM